MGRDPGAEIVAVERLRTSLRKKWMHHQLFEGGCIDAPCACGPSINIAGGTVPLAHEVVDQRIRGPRIAGDRVLVAINKCDVRDAAEIEHRDRMRPLDCTRKRAMEHRHQRRTLPARRHVGCTKIVNHRNTGLARQRGAIAELDGELLGRAMQHRLAMIADDIDRAALDAIRAQERIHRARVQRCGDLFRLPRRTGPLVTAA